MLSDDKIIDLYWNRVEEAIPATDKKYGDYCYRTADNILHNTQDAEECVNDTWLKTWESLPPERPRFLRAFLVKITRNLSIDRYRSAHADKRGRGEVMLALDELGECVSGQESVESIAEKNLLKETIKDFVSHLPERERNIFIRRYFFVESSEDIAVRYRIKEANVRKILSRSRMKLKNHLWKEGFEL